MKLKLIVHLERPARRRARPAERLPLAELAEDILGVDVRKVTIPVAAGRNLAVLIEAAVRNHILQLRGIDSTREFIARQKQEMQRRGAGEAHERCMQLVLVSGLSGSGKSVALNVARGRGLLLRRQPAGDAAARAGRLPARGRARRASRSASTRAARALGALPRAPRRAASSAASTCRVLFLEANDDDAAAALLRDAPPPSARAATGARSPRRSSASASCSRASPTLGHRIDTSELQPRALRELDPRLSASAGGAHAAVRVVRLQATASRSTPTWCSTCACCPTRTTTRSCGRSPGATRR